MNHGMESSDHTSVISWNHEDDDDDDDGGGGGGGGGLGKEVPSKFPYMVIYRSIKLAQNHLEQVHRKVNLA